MFLLHTFSLLPASNLFWHSLLLLFLVQFLIPCPSTFSFSPPSRRLPYFRFFLLPILPRSFSSSILLSLTDTYFNLFQLIFPFFLLLFVHLLFLHLHLSFFSSNESLYFISSSFFAASISYSPRTNYFSPRPSSSRIFFKFSS